MENTLGVKFIKSSLIFFVIAVTVGAIYSIRPVRDIVITYRCMIDFHSHLSLIGWLSMVILGLLYCHLEDKKIPYNESLGNKGFMFIIIGSVMMPVMHLMTGLIDISTGYYNHVNMPIIGLITISAIILTIGSYVSAYNIYRALGM